MLQAFLNHVPSPVLLFNIFTFLCDVPLEGPRSVFSFFAERKLGKYVENNIRIFCPLLS